jgi:hypothetical protein
MSGISYGTANLAADYEATFGNGERNIFTLPPVYTTEL